MPLSTTKTDKILHNLLPILNTLPNGVTHLTMLLINIKILQNRAKKIMDFEHPTKRVTLLWVRLDLGEQPFS